MKNGTFLRGSLLLTYVFLFLSCSGDDDGNEPDGPEGVISEALDPVTDIEGNSYPVRRIGDQVWMVSNLKTTTYNDGTPITEITDWEEWFYTDTEAYVWYDNDTDESTGNFGARYNGHAVNTGKLCPEGWHVPTIEEFITLVELGGGIPNAGAHLKSTALWEYPASEAYDTFGFNALPAGFRNYDGAYEDRLYEGAFWTSSEFHEDNEYSSGSAYTITLRTHSVRAEDYTRSRTMGYSCRCLKD